MADESAEKTEQPTPKKLQDAAEKGQIARSKDLGTAFVLIGTATALLIFGKMLAIAILDIGQRMMRLTPKDIFEPNSMFTAWGAVVERLAIPMGGVFAIVLLAAFIGNTLLGGFNFSWQAAGPKLSKMSPLKGFKRMFGMQAAVELLKSILKVVVVVGIAYLLLKLFFDDIMALSLMSEPNNIESAMYFLAWLFLGLCASVSVIAIVDAPYQKWNHIRQLKMSLQEIKDEYKNSEGDPHIKARIRRTQMQMSMKRMMQEVPKADVIVTNPTHYAVALKYDQGKFRAPLVVAKGLDEVALHIRKIAAEHKIPIIESPMLARSVYHTTELDHPIPEQLFAAVAQVLAYVYQLNMYKKGKGSRPKALAKELPIPEDYRH
ncbi:MAG: flagellar biosynthesis protein FlhB [Gammaproteobacteria bacterium]|nr:flagellar biosynthesis protein FlhB [Gammaproteobacteria bacterium]MBU1556324.1 flagellar biosynthesis protein FlhB [Gammaproteobacteria bacterium]MBU2069605.1 flagellar biosynthesis protein FlhB [Gammaproteobacteria bacterium]MBU2184470.1 flagellar biosynthesis protein FlhB [Gammaproteobacteria bacterium]MBU2205152.1 flagellar biosynthesis protein FlhB [Gammaproteobacteria bacterium]